MLPCLRQPGMVHKCRVQLRSRSILCISVAQMVVGCGDWGVRPLHRGERVYYHGN